MTPTVATVTLGDCRDVMRGLPAESVDAIVSDPPYGLSFMNAGWDYAVPGVDYWTCALDVLKPGAHLVAFGGTRTFHRLTAAIEDAGFEIRDCLMWLYGSGYPKSLDVSKAIDKARNDDIRHVCRFVRAAMDARNLSSRDLAPLFDCHSRLVDHWAARDTDSQPSLPTPAQWSKLKQVLNLGDDLDAEFTRLSDRKGSHGEAWHSRDVVGQKVMQDPTKSILGFSGRAHSGANAGAMRVVDLTEPHLQEAKEWDGWGTALKPAWEPIILARKPLRGTVAENTLCHGVGGLHVDAARVAGDMTGANFGGRQLSAIGYHGGTATDGTFASEENPLGRWPANVIVDDAAALAIDDQAGDVARFFYCAKVNAGERDAGLEDFEPVQVGRSNGAAAAAERGEDYEASGIGLNDTREVRNTCPTVKPLALMRWLCKLVTPAGGTILDPFAGSGSTGCAAVLEGFNVAMIDKDEAHAAIAAARVKYWQRQRLEALAQMNLF